MRTEAREGAEQETQMLFGELCEILNTQSPTHSPQHAVSNWYHVRLEADGAEGWVDAKMIAPIGGKDYSAYKKALKTAAYVAMPMAYAVSENNGQTIPLSAGTRLTNYQSTITNGVSTARFEVLGVGFRIDPGMVLAKPQELNEQNLMQAVRFFLNVPYLWGGKNAMGMDCSGFVQVVMSLFGKSLPRNASQQAKCGREILSLQKAKAGDLVFFGKTSPQPSPQGREYGEDESPVPVKITHVGIILQSPITNHQSPISVIHCSGRVKVEKIDETGIFSVERADKDHPQGIYTHYLAGIRRL